VAEVEEGLQVLVLVGVRPWSGSALRCVPRTNSCVNILSFMSCLQRALDNSPLRGSFHSVHVETLGEDGSSLDSLYCT